MVQHQSTQFPSPSWAFCSFWQGTSNLSDLFLSRRVRITSVFVAKGASSSAYSEDLGVIEMFGLWCIGELYQTGFDLHQRLDTWWEPRSRCFCPGCFCLCPRWLAGELQAALKSRAFLAPSAVAQPWGGKWFHLLHKVSEESVSTSPSLNHKPQKAGQVEGWSLTPCAVFFKTLHSSKVGQNTLLFPSPPEVACSSICHPPSKERRYDQGKQHLD